MKEKTRFEPICEKTWTGDHKEKDKTFHVDENKIHIRHVQ